LKKILKPMLIGTTTGSITFKAIEAFMLNQAINAFTYAEPTVSSFNTIKEIVKVFL